MAENKSGRKGELFNEKLITPLVLIFVPIGSFEFFNRSNYLLRWTKLIESQKKNEKKQKRNDFLFLRFKLRLNDVCINKCQFGATTVY